MPNEDKSSRTESVWNSLETAKILVTLLLAIVGGAFTTVTYLQGRQDREMERNAESVRRAAEQRLVIWREASPILNDIYSYHMYIGGFKDIDPETLIADKRKLDRLMYSNEVLFSSDYFQAYLDFMKSAFSPYQGWLEDPKLRTTQVRPLDMKTKALFTNEDCQTAIFERYWNLQALSTKELNVYSTKNEPQPGLPTGSLSRPNPRCHAQIVKQKTPLCFGVSRL
jgi:hypothetical protein